MVISEAHRYIFIAVPKTGTTSISSFLLSADPTAVANVVCVNGAEQRLPTHVTALEVKTLLGSRFDDYTSFAFVRNPFSKILSSYYFYRDGRAARKVNAGEAPLFTKAKVWSARALPFSVWSLLYPYNACRRYLVDERGELLVNHIGYFENFQHDLSKILVRLGFTGDLCALPHLNRTDHDDFESYVGTGTLRRALTYKVRGDLDLFFS